MISYMCNYSFLLILLYKHDDNKTQESICTIKIIFKTS